MVRMKNRWAALALAGSVWHGASAQELWTPATKVAGLYPDSNSFIFTTVYANPTVSTCDNGSRFAISLSNANYKGLVAALLTAYALGKDVYLHLPSSTPACEPVVDRFQVR